MPDCPLETHPARLTAADLDAGDDGDGRLSEAECWDLCEAHADLPTSLRGAASADDTAIVPTAERWDCAVERVGEDAYDLRCEVETVCARDVPRPLRGSAHALA